MYSDTILTIKRDYFQKQKTIKSLALRKKTQRVVYEVQIKFSNFFLDEFILPQLFAGLVA
jgi:hypothetical protein